MNFNLDNVSAVELLNALGPCNLSIKGNAPVPHKLMELRHHLRGLGEKMKDHHIAGRLVDWAVEYAECECNARHISVGERAAALLIERLESIDCAGCNAPSGLIYNHDIAHEFPVCWDEIDEALDEHLSETGETPAPGDDALTCGWLVWFAYEHHAHKLAGMMRHTFDID